jgi:hypothetical protein
LDANQETRTSFSSFQSLRRSIAERRSFLFLPTSAWVGSVHLPYTVTLQFQVTEAVSLCSLEVDVVDFIRLTFDMDTQTMIQFSLETKDDECLRKETFSISLRLLRQKSFLLLSFLMVHHPNFQTMLCPALWIKGHNALPFQAVYPSIGNRNGRTIPLLHQNILSKLSDAQIQAMGMQIVRTTEHCIDPLHTGDALPERVKEQQSLYAMWNSMREEDWQWVTV